MYSVHEIVWYGLTLFDVLSLAVSFCAGDRNYSPTWADSPLCETTKRLWTERLELLEVLELRQILTVVLIVHLSTTVYWDCLFETISDSLGLYVIEALTKHQKFLWSMGSFKHIEAKISDMSYGNSWHQCRCLADGMATAARGPTVIAGMRVTHPY